MGGQKPREIAATLLLQREKAGEYIENLLETALQRSELSGADRALLQELVYGACRWQSTLDALIARKTGARDQKSGLRILLRLGLYQIFWLSRIPDHAAVHETVELGKRMGFGPQAGFLNAVLRGYLREKEQTVSWLAELKATDPPVGWSHPAWLFERWSKRWGAEEALKLMEWNNRPAPAYARVNRLKIGPEALMERWAGEGVEAAMRVWDWLQPGDIYELSKVSGLSQLPSFREGGFYVQDPSTLLSVSMLGAQPGERVLDLCSAPGGKTCAIAQAMANTGKLIAHDPDPKRLERVRENCGRLGIECVELLSDLNRIAGEQFDRVLVDAPCSNSGVMRRRVDLRWRISQAEVARLAREQERLLAFAATVIKPGGALVYSTCSMESEENSEVLRKFVEGHEGRFHLEREREILPFREGVDGAYAALLRAC